MFCIQHRINFCPHFSINVICAHLASLSAELGCQNLTSADLELLERIFSDMSIVVKIADVVEYFDLTAAAMIAKDSELNSGKLLVESLFKSYPAVRV